MYLHLRMFRLDTGKKIYKNTEDKNFFADQDDASTFLLVQHIWNDTGLSKLTQF